MAMDRHPPHGDPPGAPAAVSARIAAWTGPAARAALAEWSAGSRAAGDPLGLATFLRARFSAELSRELAEQLELRVRARAKFRRPEELVFTRKGLEQATRLEVARWRALRIAAAAPRGPVLDATCGLGADSLALIEAGLEVLALEHDEFTARAAAHNLAASTGRCCVAWGSALELPARAEYLIVDPDRRAEGPRSLDPEAWRPPLSRVLELARRARGAQVKLAPGVDLAGAFGSRDLGPRWLPVWVSAGGELRECGLWFGEWAPEPGGSADEGPPARLREAVRISPTGEALSLREVPVPVEGLSPEAAAAVRWIAEPDPALIRSGLLGNAARRAGARPLSGKLAFLGSEQPIVDPLLDAWPVLGAAALDPRRVRRLLDLHDIGEVSLLVRGHPDPAAVLAKRLRGGGSRRGFAAVARLERGHHFYLLDRPS